MVEKYINKYCEGFDFKPCEKHSEEICGITIESESFLYSEGINRRIKSHVSFKKDGMVYECDCADIKFPNISLITLYDKKYLCFSRCLYGFIFLNVDTLQVEYEYFPEKVLGDEESFIVTEAKNFGEFLIFDGCYWACPYGIYAYDHSSKKFADISGEYDLIYDVEVSISEGKLILTGRNKEEKQIEISITEKDIKDLIDTKGTLDF